MPRYEPKNPLRWTSSGGESSILKFVYTYKVYYNGRDSRIDEGIPCLNKTYSYHSHSYAAACLLIPTGIGILPAMPLLVHHLIKFRQFKQNCINNVLRHADELVSGILKESGQFTVSVGARQQTLFSVPPGQVLDDERETLLGGTITGVDPITGKEKQLNL